MSKPESPPRDRARWSLAVSADTDRAVRRYLGERGAKKGDLTALVETAVNARLFQEVIRETKLRNARASAEAIDAAVQRALAK
jgi:hypothetical protein